MYEVKAIYDGNNFKFAEPLLIKENYEVVITFTKSIDKSYFIKMICMLPKQFNEQIDKALLTIFDINTKA